tara:strand:+ start:67 stop:678 length:612 start_codon:yes stop_codon:yes gene_type:complete
MPSLLEFVFDKKKPIPGEWEYDMHPGPYSQEQVYDAPLYQGEQGGLMDDWIPDEEPYKYPGVKFVTRGPYDEEAGKYTSETPLGEWEIPGTAPPTERAWGPPSGGVPGSKNIPQHMADWILTNYPEQEMSNRYEISGWDVVPGAGSYADDPDSWTPLYNNPILSYSAEHNLAYLNSPEYKSRTESTSGFPSGMSPGDLSTWDV